MLDSISSQLREAELRRAEAQRAHQVSCCWFSPYRNYTNHPISITACRVLICEAQFCIHISLLFTLKIQ